MNTSIPKHDIPRLMRNLIRTGTVAEVDLETATCRVNTDGNVTDRLHWPTSRAGRSRSWWAPSAGEQVLLFCLGGELDTASVIPGVFSDEFPAPAAPAGSNGWRKSGGRKSGSVKPGGIKIEVSACFKCKLLI